MANYRPIQGDWNIMNDAQKNQAAIDAGYTGLQDFIDNQNKPAQGNPSMTNGQVSLPGNANGGAGGGIMGGVGLATPTLNLPELYKSLYASKGITELEAGLTAKEKAHNDRISKINDNPFLSEATRIGRIAKLKTDYQNEIAADQSTLATRKADIETEMNIQTKQFDINSQQAQLALSQFNSLLESGALSGASGTDIANITRSTGLSSSMIQSAINAKKQKDVNTTTVQFEDSSGQGFVVIDQQGNILNKQVIAGPKPKAADKSSETEIKAANIQQAKSAAKQGATVSQMFSLFAGVLEPDMIYQIYNSNSIYGPDKGSIKSLEKYGVTQPKY